MKQVYEELGGELKSLRQVAGESVEDVSDAVEVPVDVVRKIEAGTERPEEDMLAMLLSHFGVGEDDAVRIWKLAGYEDDAKEEAVSEKKDDNSIRIQIPNNSPVMYTDMVQVMSNQYGVVLHFLQMSPNNQATVVSRIGMSKEHAESLLDLLKRNLEEKSDD